MPKDSLQDRKRGKCVFLTSTYLLNIFYYVECYKILHMVYNRGTILLDYREYEFKLDIKYQMIQRLRNSMII